MHITSGGEGARAGCGAMWMDVTYLWDEVDCPECLKLRPKASTNDDTHVYPLNDLHEHITEGVECPCNPTIEVIGASLLIVHNAFDKREIIEDAVAIMNEGRSCEEK